MSHSVSSQDKISAALHEVVDPEVGVNIVDLGLIYHVQLQGRRIDIEMTMTTSARPLHFSIRTKVKAAIRRHLPEVREVHIKRVWHPPWHPVKMSERAKRQLGWLGR